MKSIHCTLLSAWCLLFPITLASYPFQDPTLQWSKRVDDLVSRLNLTEIAHFSVEYSHHTRPSVERLGIKPYRLGEECLRGMVRMNATAWPQSLGIAATFSHEVVYNMSRAVSYELRAQYNADLAKGVYGEHGLSCFSPVINIARHPLWGRNQETYGEDPFLSGQLATQYVKGLQGDHPRYVRASAGCKHFDVHGGPENIPVSRFSFDAKVSERDWRMTFLPQFKACVDAGTYNLMCSYNSINGTPACANSKLMTDILRKEWNFTGYVISDSGAIERIISAHKFIDNEIDTVATTIKAGCNAELTADKNIYLNQVAAVQKGKLTEQQVRDNIRPVFNTRMRLGEFDPASMNPYSQINTSVILSSEHRQLATRAAISSFVLLKNDNNYLPLKKVLDKIAVVGPFADGADLFGDYSAFPDKRFVSTPLDGLQNLGKETRHAAGCKDAGCGKYNRTAIKEAVTGARFVFVCLGTGVTLEAEGHDRADLHLPGNQLQLLKDAVFFSREAPLVLLLFNAGPLEITWAKLNPDVDAIIECFLPAMSAGDALHSVITMATPESVPAGRLPMTWPAEIHQVPPITDYGMDGHTYRYYHGDPLYPFGYGLSYSQFRYETLTVSPSSVKAGDSVTVKVSVMNKGPYDAEEVVQLYLAWNNSPPVPVPRWTLVAFDRQMINVGKTRDFQFTVSGEQMAVWTDHFQVLPGKMTLYASGQQPFQRTSTEANVLSATFSITTASNNTNNRHKNYTKNNIFTDNHEDDRLRFSNKYKTDQLPQILVAP